MKAVPEWLWAPLAAELLALIIGATGIWAGPPWLFPSFGPTIFLQVHRPEQDAARPYPIIVGHAAGVVAAVVSVLLVGAGSAPSPFFGGVELVAPLGISHGVGRDTVSAGATQGLAPACGRYRPVDCIWRVQVALRDLGIITTGVLLIAIWGEGLFGPKKCQASIISPATFI